MYGFIFAVAVLGKETETFTVILIYKVLQRGRIEIKPFRSGLCFQFLKCICTKLKILMVAMKEGKS